MQHDHSLSAWNAALESLRGRIGDDNFQLWLREANCRQTGDNTVEIGAPTALHSNVLRERYGQLLAETLSAHMGAEVTVAFTVRSAPARAAATLLDRLPPAGAQRDDSAGGAVSRLRFDNFVVGDCNRMAYLACRRSAGGDASLFNPLFIYGGSGLGKTHLLNALAWELKSRLDAPVVFVTGESFARQFLASLHKRTLEPFRNRLRNCGALIVDDLQALSGKTSCQQEFLFTYDALHKAGRQIVLSAPCAPHKLEEFNPTLVNRLIAGLGAELTPPDFPTRMALLRAKCRERAVQLPEDVMECVAQRATSSLRELEGALTMLSAYVNLYQTRLSVDTARELLAARFSPAGEAHLADIVRLVCDDFRVNKEALFSTSRSPRAARPRQVAMYLAREHTTLAASEIGKYFGNRTHATVFCAHAKVVALAGKDVEFRKRLDTITAKLTQPRNSSWTD